MKKKNSTNKTREHETTFNDEDGHNNKKRKTKERPHTKAMPEKRRLDAKSGGLEERMKEFTRVKGHRIVF